MVAGFRRSMSLPGQNPSSPGPKCRASPEKACHVRSTSLPCRSHPAIAGLEDEIRALRTWLSLPAPESGSPTWISTGLARIDLLHSSLDDLLQIPQAQDPLRRPSSAPWTDRLLDDFLRFADAYGSFRSALISLKQTQSELHTAIRRRDEARLASSLRSQKRIEKDLAKLAVSIREASRSPMSTLAADTAEVEMAGIVREVTVATVTASAAVLGDRGGFLRRIGGGGVDVEGFFLGGGAAEETIAVAVFVVEEEELGGVGGWCIGEVGGVGGVHRGVGEPDRGGVQKSGKQQSVAP